MWEVVGN